MTRIVWWEVETPDPRAFRLFHGALWGWRFRPAFEGTALGAEYWIIEAGGTGIGGLQRGGPIEVTAGAGVRVYLEVDDLEATLSRVVGLGGTVERRRTALGGDDRWFGTFLDPVGVSFGLWTENDGAG